LSKDQTISVGGALLLEGMIPVSWKRPLPPGLRKAPFQWLNSVLSIVPHFCPQPPEVKKERGREE
jgi:hypothetical protein